MRRNSLFLFGCMLIVALGVGPAFGQQQFGGLFIYPNKAQNQDQQNKDQMECYNWAKTNTGFDPMATPTASQPPPQKEAKKGGVVRGGLGGAAVGGVAGAIAGDTKKGLAIGAASGALLGGMRRSSQRRQEANSQQQWEQQQVAQYNQGRSEYNRAFSACMEGRGYTVK